MKSNRKLGFVGLFIMALCAGACIGTVEPPGSDEPVGEAQQALVTCSSDCSGVPGASPITKTCNTSCTATNAQITCDGVTTLCSSQCASNYGQTCTYQQCPVCGGHTYSIYGTYDCSGVCETNDYCCCWSGHLC